jgi:hypothetical protein
MTSIRIFTLISLLALGNLHSASKPPASIFSGTYISTNSVVGAVLVDAASGTTDGTFYSTFTLKLRNGKVKGTGNLAIFPTGVFIRSVTFRGKLSNQKRQGSGYSEAVVSGRGNDGLRFKGRVFIQKSQFGLMNTRGINLELAKGGFVGQAVLIRR